MKKFCVTVEQGSNVVDLLVSEFGLPSLIVVLADSDVTFKVSVL